MVPQPLRDMHAPLPKGHDPLPTVLEPEAAAKGLKKNSAWARLIQKVYERDQAMLGMDIRAADGGHGHVDDHIVGMRQFRFLHLFEGESMVGLQYDGFHSSPFPGCHVSYGDQLCTADILHNRPLLVKMREIEHGIDHELIDTHSPLPYTLAP